MKKLSKTAMARQRKTSRSSLERLSDPEISSVTLDTIERAAAVIGKRVRLELVDYTLQTESSKVSTE